MKVLIMAGGVGSRLGEETVARPKPMVEIGHRPILWHIMKIYGNSGFNEFVIALGYKGEQIKRYMAEYATMATDMTFDFKAGDVVNHNKPTDDWVVTLADTGQHTETGGRMLRARHYLDDGTFMMTYGDGVADVDLQALLDFHKSHGLLATVTAVRPTARFGHMDLDGHRVEKFNEKSQLDEGWINGGFFVLEPGVFEYLDRDCDWSREPLERLAADGQLAAFEHRGFWQCMDTLRDKIYLQSLWDDDAPPWRVWA